MEWTRGRTIGRGSSATVSLATFSSGDVFAVKSAELSQSTFLQREQRILSSLNSASVVGYRGCDITKEDGKLFYNLLIEYAPGGSLADAIRRSGGGLGEPTIVHYTRQILQGLDHVHSAGIVHCDIKASNILIGNDGAAQIADFGCSKRLDSDSGAEPISGTPAFMAPEVARGEQQGLPSDVWSLGCTIVEIASGRPPWPRNGSDPASILYRIAYSAETPEMPCFLSEEAKDFLSKCLRRNPEERWTVSELVSHPFLAESNSNAVELGNKVVVEESSWSPTSVLDRGVWNWNSVEESESVSGSAREKIEQLAELAAGPNWDWDCDRGWIRVRRYQI